MNTRTHCEIFKDGEQFLCRNYPGTDQIIGRTPDAADPIQVVLVNETMQWRISFENADNAIGTLEIGEAENYETMSPGECYGSIRFNLRTGDLVELLDSKHRPTDTIKIPYEHPALKMLYIYRKFSLKEMLGEKK